MPLTDKITNPEALKLIKDFQSGAIFAPFKSWLTKYKWFLVSGGIVFALLLALAIGKSLVNRSQTPVFLPPDISTPGQITPTTFVSKYEPLRQTIMNFGTDLPDPIIPPFDNALDLESANI